MKVKLDRAQAKSLQNSKSVWKFSMVQENKVPVPSLSREFHPTAETVWIKKYWSDSIQHQTSKKRDIKLVLMKYKNTIFRNLWNFIIMLLPLSVSCCLIPVLPRHKTVTILAFRILIRIKKKIKKNYWYYPKLVGDFIPKPGMAYISSALNNKWIPLLRILA